MNLLVEQKRFLRKTDLRAKDSENRLFSVSPLKWDPKTRDFKPDMNNSSEHRLSEKSKSLSPDRGDSFGAPTQR